MTPEREPPPWPQSWDLVGRRVVVWGVGTHGGGLAAARHCQRQGAHVALLDRRGPDQAGESGIAAAVAGWPWMTGERHRALLEADLVLTSPAIGPAACTRRPGLRAVGSDALFFAQHRGARVFVTGTKGKSTTAAALATLLGWPLAGNGHLPLLDFLASHDPDSPVVCELSSFQLWWLRPLRPRFTVAVLTSCTSDHLDWHPDLDHYRRSKLDALAWADTTVISPKARTLVEAALPTLPLVTHDGQAFYSAQGRRLAPLSLLPLAGAHNAANACLALTAALQLGLAPELIPERLARIQALPHRLQTVHQTARLRFVDDSTATTPEATLAALAAFPAPVVLIAGGLDKGADLNPVAAAAVAAGITVVCLGTCRERLAGLVIRHGGTAQVAGSMPEAVHLAIGLLPDQGGTVLLSPACASLDMFADFHDRGLQFAAAARNVC